jgi:D-alanyl-D-alanine carboxypeptidase
MWLAVGTLDGLDWSGAAGFSDLARTVEAEIGDGVHMASITKSFTAVAVLSLVDSGRLTMDARLVDLLDATIVGEIPHVEEVTVAQLLDHSSGIYGFNNNVEYLSTLVGAEADAGRTWSPRELVALANEGVNEPFGLPGEGHRYGDTNYVLLGLVVEQITGRPLKEVVTNSLLRPLQMDATYYRSDYLNGTPGVASPARGYLKLTPELMSFLPVHEKFPRVRDDLAETTSAGETIDAAACMVTTAADLHRFGRALFGGELLGPSTQSWLVSVAEGLETEPAGTERIGVLRAYSKPYGVVVAAEGDGPGGSNTILAFHPETGVIVVAMTNIHGLWFENEFFIDEVVGEVVRAYRGERPRRSSETG